MADDTKADSKELREESRRLKQETGIATQILNKFSNTVGKATTSLKSLYKTQTKVTDLFEGMSTSVQSTTDSVVDMALKGRKSALGLQLEIRRLAEETSSLSRKTRDASISLENNVKRYNDLRTEIVAVEKKMRDLAIAHQKGNKTEAQSRKEAAELRAEYTRLRGQMKAVSNNINSQAADYHNLSVAMLDHQRRTINTIKETREAQREMMRMKGVLGSIGAEFLSWKDKKLFEAMDTRAWVEHIKKAYAELKKVYEMVAPALNENILLAEQYNKLITEGEDTLLGAGKLLLENQEANVKTAFKLKMSYEEVENIQKEVAKRRLHIFGAKDSQEANKNLREITDTVAEFSRRTGVDAEVAMNAMQRRLESVGMSTQKANDDLLTMVTTLKEMSMGVGKDIIGIDQMVRLIEDASAASESYVVDTRLMTQAMRAAANEAERMGASKKMAMKAAQEAGKIAGGGASSKTSVQAYVAMQDIIKKMLVDPTPYLKGLNDQQRKYAEGILDEVRRGEIAIHQAIPLMEKAIGSTDKVLVSKFERLVKVYGRSPIKWDLIGQELGMDENSARIWYQSMQKATDAQQSVNSMMAKYNMKFKEMPLSDFMSMQYDSVEEMLQATKGRDKQLEKLKTDFKMSQKDAEEYLDIHASEKLSSGQKEIMKRRVMAPSLRTERIQDRLVNAMKKAKGEGLEGDKLKEAMQQVLQDSFVISEKNTEAQQEVVKLSEKIAGGNTDISEDIEQLGKIAASGGNDQKVMVSLLDQILVAIRTMLPNAMKGVFDKLNTPLAKTAIGALVATTLGVLTLFGGNALRKLVMRLSDKAAGEIAGKAGKRGVATVLAGSKKGVITELLEKIAEKKGGKEIAKALAKLPRGKGIVGTVGEVSDDAADVMDMPGSSGGGRRPPGGGKGGSGGGGGKWGKYAARGAAAAYGGYKAYSHFSEKNLGDDPLGDTYAGLQGLAGALSLVPGPVGAVARVFMLATFAGDVLNKGLEYLGAGAKESADAMLKLTKNSSLLSWVFGQKTTKDLKGEEMSLLKAQKHARAVELGLSKEQEKKYWEDFKKYQEENKVSTADAARDFSMKKWAQNQGIPTGSLNDKSTSDQLQNIADNTKNTATLALDQKSRVTQGKPLPSGGTFNVSATTKSAASYEGAIKGQVDESKRPRLGGDAGATTTGSSQTIASTDAASYNEAEDSVSVKFFGLAGFVGMLKKKEAQARGEA